MKRYPSLIAASLILAALAPLQIRAATNTWNNSSGNSLWDSTSSNWLSPTIWSDGDEAVFGATGVGTVTLGSAITVHDQTFNAAGYTIAGNGNALTFGEGTNSTITVNATYATNAASIYGTNGLTLQGTGTLVLTGDPAALTANHYTGGTYVRSGTLILAAANANASGTSYAVDSIEALDAGATVKFGTTFNGTSFVSPTLHQVASHAVGSHLRMTGGTFELNNEPRNQHLPIPDGTGLIVNTGTNVQSGLVMYADGQNHEFSGVIADGGPLVGNNLAGGPTPQGPGRQIGIVSIAAGINGGVWTLSGSNTYSGSTRLQFGSVKLAGNGTIGFPTATGSLTGPLRIYGPSYLDLNGHNQTIALMTSGDTGGKILNSAVGTVSTLTFGYGNEQSARTANMQYIDNLGTGGVLALKKVATGPPFINPATSTPATNCAQTLSGVNTYSGDTTVEGGALIMANTAAVSSNSVFRLFTVAQGQCPDNTVSLVLNYAGTAPVKGLYINGVSMPPGVYGSSTAPITGTGTLTVVAPQTWNNASGNFLWDLTSSNWTSSPWTDGQDAVFGPTGVGTVLLDSPITVHDQTFNTTGYSIVASNGNTLTLAGANPSIIVNAAFATNATSLNGANGLTIQGTGTLVLTGDPAALTANHYTGGTYVRSGTLILAAPNANVSGTSYAVDSIEALDAGATVKFGTTFNGTSFVSPTLHQVASHAVGSRLRMTGGTFELNNEPRNQHLPIPDGNGLIVNTGTNVQSGLILYADGQDHEFSGVIADGGPLVGNNLATGPTPQGPGRQIGIVSIAAGINGGVWTLSGSNTYSGSTRLQFGSVKLAGNGTIGFPTATGSLTGPLRIYGPSYLDLNGHNQTIALMTSGDTGGKILNSAVGTVSTLTFGYGNEQSARTANMQYIDNLGVGGILALKKVATGPPYINPATSTPATNCAQTLSGVNTYSGDTTVEGGALIMANTAAVSSNSVFRLFTVAQGQCPDNSVSLVLNYAGTASVKGLFINGVQMPNGTYGSSTAPITGTGTITVTGFAPVSLVVTQSGGALTFSWQGVYKLQTKTNSIIGPWFDYPGGGTSGVNVPVDRAKGSVYFRLSTY